MNLLKLLQHFFDIFHAIIDTFRSMEPLSYLFNFCNHFCASPTDIHVDLVEFFCFLAYDIFIGIMQLTLKFQIASPLKEIIIQSEFPPTLLFLSIRFDIQETEGLIVLLFLLLGNGQHLLHIDFGRIESAVFFN